MGIIDKIKAVWDKVFKTNDVKKIFGIETGRSSGMDTALSKYKDMRSGIPYWCTGRIKPTRFSNVICREIANLTLFNADIQITGNNELKKKFDSVMNTLQEKQEESCATCGMMVKSKPGIRREQRYGCADIIIIREDGITFYGIQKAVLLAVEGHRHNHLVFLL